jgi:hypothetical protein
MKLFFLSLTFLLAGCGPIAITTTGASVIYLGYQQSKHGGVKQKVQQVLLRSSILSMWEEGKLDEPLLDVVSVGNVAVIIGAPVTKEGLDKAKALTFVKADNVQCLSDGIKPGSWDSSLAVSIRLKLMFDFSISARNYYIYAMRNQIFVVGTAGSEMEKRAIIEKIKAMNSVETVRSYIVVSNEENGYVLLKE